jgi:hypothetical protein
MTTTTSRAIGYTSDIDTAAAIRARTTDINALRVARYAVNEPAAGFRLVEFVVARYAVVAF